MELLFNDAQSAQSAIDSFIEFMHQADAMFNRSELENDANQWWYNNVTKL